MSSDSDDEASSGEDVPLAALGGKHLRPPGINSDESSSEDEAEFQGNAQDDDGEEEEEAAEEEEEESSEEEDPDDDEDFVADESDEEEDLKAVEEDEDDEEEEDDDDDDSDDVPLASLKTPRGGGGKKAAAASSGKKKEKTPAAKKKTAVKAKNTKAAAKTKKAAAKAKKSSSGSKSTGTSSSATASASALSSASNSEPMTASGQLYAKSEKGRLIRAVLCRWWYVSTWPDLESIPPCPRHYDPLDGFPGVYVCTSGDEVGRIVDHRNPATCPSFVNYAKKSSDELVEMLVKAIEAQREQLLEAEGEGTDTERGLTELENWARKLNTAKADREADRVLKAGKLAL